ncbi:hypothetical protein CDAR_579391 [Caerostris darwini]|uniref:Uncharacterized protein n=1 Tax=Caerostris darwini TaxID=1538125 RepID=A0AAV4V4B0_9ARAC|nr:hypothetical protein CDAR_579391 [Caerostris darwini]
MARKFSNVTSVLVEDYGLQSQNLIIFQSVVFPEDTRLSAQNEEQRKLPLSTGRKCYVNVAKGTSGENGSVSKMAGKDSLVIEDGTEVPERDFSSG